jgi:hypothetical protein
MAWCLVKHWDSFTFLSLLQLHGKNLNEKPMLEMTEKCVIMTVPVI